MGGKSEAQFLTSEFLKKERAATVTLVDLISVTCQRKLAPVWCGELSRELVEIYPSYTIIVVYSIGGQKMVSVAMTMRAPGQAAGASRP